MSDIRQQPVMVDLGNYWGVEIPDPLSAEHLIIAIGTEDEMGAFINRMNGTQLAAYKEVVAALFPIRNAAANGDWHLETMSGSDWETFLEALSNLPEVTDD